MFAVAFLLSHSTKGHPPMAFRANQQLREDMWDYRLKASAGADENVQSFSQSTAKEYGTTALGLVHQAAEIFSGMENHVREIEARAEALCKSLTEKLQLAEKQRDASERARHEVVHEFNGKLQEVSRALQQAQSRIADAEDRATAAEFCAQAAEVQLNKANAELAAVEDAIRKRLL
jgi:DNA-binding ferritin-like protein